MALNLVELTGRNSKNGQSLDDQLNVFFERRVSGVTSRLPRHSGCPAEGKFVAQWYPTSVVILLRLKEATAWCDNPSGRVMRPRVAVVEHPTYAPSLA